MHIIPNPTRNMKTCDYWINDEVMTTGNYSHFAITLFSGNNTVTINGELIGRTLQHDYGNFLAYSCETLVDFMFEYTRFVQLHKHDFERIYKALYADYNPIENYNKISQISNNGSTGSKSDDKLTVTSYQVSDDTVNNTGDSAFIPRDKAITSGVTETSNILRENTHGNIGVTKSTDMIHDEINLRVNNNFVKTICNMFAEMELI